MKYPQLVSGRAVSGVSDWLSAELEALGIDGPLYSRLVLSLLHRPLQINVLDLVELHCVNRDREGRRARKRSRPPGSTVTGGGEGVWLSTKGHIRGSYWDPDILKRCAAVECLRTASDQKSDIERLVDELCTKLREIENESSLDSLDDCPKAQRLVESAEKQHDCIISPTELASKYYAAFPALSDPDITFYPSCHSSSVWSASIKNNISNPTRKHYFDKKPKMWKETDMDRKQKPISKKPKTKGTTRRGNFPPQWDTVWELGNEELLREYINNQCNVRDKREEGNSALKIDDNRRLYERDLDDVHFNQEWILEDDIHLKMNAETDMDKMSVARFEAKFNENVEALWKDADDNTELKDNECSIDELNVPVDIQDLLSSPSDLLFEEVSIKQEKPRGFIQAGTNIINSIWSDNTVVTNEDDAGENLSEKSFYPSKNSLEAAAEYKLEMVRSFWENSEIETKELNYKKSELKNDFKSVPWQINFSILNDLAKNKWSDDAIETEPFLSLASLSSKYQVLNHNRELSDFKEVIPGSSPHCASKNASSEDIFSLPIDCAEVVEEPEEDLLTSDRTHFKPIKDEIYADGTVFEVSNSLAKVNYTRSESGTLSLITDHETKQYMIYRTTIPDFLFDDLNSSETDSLIRKESVLAFCVKQNEKSCQTDEDMINNTYAATESKVKKMAPIGRLRKREEYQLPRDYNIDDEEMKCSCNRNYKCFMHKKQLNNYDDDTDMSNFDYQNWCNKCSNNNNNNIWRGEWYKNDANTGGMENLQQIWSNRVNCETCSIDMSTNDKKHYQELKRELSRDGEEIMSDLSYMQSLYIGSDWADDDTNMDDEVNQDLATSEAAYDVNKVITNCHQIFQQFKPLKIEDPLKVKYVFGNKESSLVVVAPPAAPPETEQWKSGSDRKRRHSSSQRPCNEAVAADCKKPHCKLSHEITAMPCPFWGDSWGQHDGECGGLAGCQFQHLTTYPRPLTR